MRSATPSACALRCAGVALALGLAGLAGASPAAATQVASLAAAHHDGQTFLTWTAPPGEGWIYRVYASPTLIADANDLATATLIGSVGDSTWCDRRLSGVLSSTFAFRPDSLAPPLDSTQGMFVETALSVGPRYFAITAQNGIGAEDVTIEPGVNATIGPVTEALDRPRPVYQRSLPIGNVLVEIYTLWTSRDETPEMPAMGNRASIPFDCSIVRGHSGAALFVKPHARNGNLLQTVASSGIGTDWQLNLDDPTENDDLNTWWYGTHESYDMTSNENLPPLSGVCVDYTMRRVVFTLEWARRQFAFDRERVYGQGGSMAASGCLFLAMARPDLIAAVLANLPKVDYSFDSDPVSANFWNAGMYERLIRDRMWGSIATNLPTSEGPGVYDRLDAGFLAGQLEGTSLPPIIMFSGKRDYVVGWKEKLAFYAAMRAHRHGGKFYYDQRTHTDGYAAWAPMNRISELFLLRSDRSYPALSNCSTDGNPGTGLPNSGDSIGVINAYVAWDSAMVDQPERWETRLTLVDLQALWGTVPAPESLTVDVTPRRLQHFAVEADSLYEYSVRRLADGALLQHGYLTPDAYGLLTVRAARIHRTGTTVTLRAVEPDELDAPRGPGAARLAMAAPSVVRGGVIELAVSWPHAGDARVELFDAGGRRVREPFRGATTAGTRVYRLAAGDLASGVYFARAVQSDAHAIARIAILH